MEDLLNLGTPSLQIVFGLSIHGVLLYVWCLMLEEHFFPPLMHWFVVGSTSFVSDDWIYAQFKRLHRRLHSEVVQLVQRITILQCWVELLLVNLSLAPSKDALQSAY